MRILFLTDDYPEEGGSSVATVVRSLSQGLTQTGHDVWVITAHRKEESSAILYRERVVSLPISYRRALRHYKCLWIPAISQMLGKEMKRLKPDIVHAHNIHEFLTYDATRIARKHAQKVFITLHDVMSFSYARLATEKYLRSEGGDVRTTFFDHIAQAGLQWNPLRNILIRRALRNNVRTVFAVSGALRHALSVHGIRGAEVTWNATDTLQWQASGDTIAAFKKKHDIIGKKVILFGGRLSRDKGSTPLFAAFRMIHENMPHAVLLITGSPERLPGLVAEAGAKDLLPFLRCTGWLPQREMAAAYGAADVVTTPSLCLDTFNLMNIEAMSAAKPVVGTIFGGTPEIVIDGVTGFVHNPLKTDQYADTLRRLLQDDSLAKEMGEAGKKRAEQYFSTNTLVQELLSYYHR